MGTQLEELVTIFAYAAGPNVLSALRRAAFSARLTVSRLLPMIFAISVTLNPSPCKFTMRCWSIGRISITSSIRCLLSMRSATSHSASYAMPSICDQVCSSLADTHLRSPRAPSPVSRRMLRSKPPPHSTASVKTATPPNASEISSPRRNCLPPSRIRSGLRQESPG